MRSGDKVKTRKAGCGAGLDVTELILKLKNLEKFFFRF